MLLFFKLSFHCCTYFVMNTFPKKPLIFCLNYFVSRTSLQFANDFAAYIRFHYQSFHRDHCYHRCCSTCYQRHCCRRARTWLRQPVRMRGRQAEPLRPPELLGDQCIVDSVLPRVQESTVAICSPPRRESRVLLYQPVKSYFRLQPSKKPQEELKNCAEYIHLVTNLLFLRKFVYSQKQSLTT